MMLRPIPFLARLDCGTPAAPTDLAPGICVKPRFYRADNPILGAP
jgi:hypothetical protein